MNRDTFIFYRSFYESINELQPEEQLLVYNAIFEYSLNFTEPKLTGVCKTIFILIKPILDANNQRYINGSKPKNKGNNKQEGSETEAKLKQDESKPEGNKDKDVDKDKNNHKNKDENINTHPMQDWVNDNCPNVKKLTNQLTYEQCDKLMLEFSNEKLKDILTRMENYKDLAKKYTSVNLTIRGWIKRNSSEQSKPIRGGMIN